MNWDDILAEPNVECLFSVYTNLTLTSYENTNTATHLFSEAKPQVHVSSSICTATMKLRLAPRNVSGHGRFVICTCSCQDLAVQKVFGAASSYDPRLVQSLLDGKPVHQCSTVQQHISTCPSIM